MSPTTVRNILKAKGIEPAPDRRKRTTWKEFLRSNWSCLAATDFFTVEVWTPRGLVTYYVLFVIELATRRVHVAGITANPDERWMMQVARNVTDPVGGFFREKRFLILDRDTKFTAAFQALLKGSGVRPVVLPARSPNLNAYAERFVRSAKSECTSRLILFGERSLRHAIDEYVEHYNEERPHQGIGNRAPIPIRNDLEPAACVERRERLGGLLNSYSGVAA